MFLHFKKFFAVGFLLAVTAVSYTFGLSDYFLHDDGVNITQNPSIQIKDLKTSSLALAANSGNAGLGKRPLSMLSFALNHYISGLDAKSYKIVNLLIHLINGVLVFVFFQLLLTLYQGIHKQSLSKSNILLISLFLSGLWLLHPLNLTAVLYVVQRMTSLSAFFTLTGLFLYTYGRKKLLEDRPTKGLFSIASALLICTPLAVLSKENGILLPFFILLIEATLLNFKTSPVRLSKTLALGIGFIVFLVALSGLIYLVKNQSVISAGYLFRDFTLWECLMTEARVFWLYIYLIFVPNISMMGLNHDDILVSQSLLQPITTIASIAGLGLLVGAAIKWRTKYPVFAFGIGFFLIGQSLESTIFPLEIVYEHRNYLPSLGILIIPIYYILSAKTSVISRQGQLAIMSFLLILMTSVTSLRAHEWEDPFQMRLLEVQRHPLSARAHSDIASIYDHMPGKSDADYADFYFKAMHHYQSAAELSSTDLTGLFGLIVINAERELPIDRSLMDQLESKLRSTPLSPPNINALIGTERCYSSRKCSIEISDMRRLFNAALANPTLQSGNKSMVLMSYSKVVFKEDRQEAIELVEKALKLAPQLMGNRLAYVDLLIASGKLESAAKELGEIKDLRTSSSYENTINALELKLHSSLSENSGE